MKKIISSLILILVLIAAGWHTSSVAATPLSDQAVLTFADLGLDADIILRGPYDSRDIRFDLPPNWALQPGAKLEIEITAFAAGSDVKVQNDLFGALLEVSMNERLQQSIPLKFGDDVVYEVPLSAESLVSPYEDGGHKLSFFLDAAVDCSFDFHDTTVMVDLKSTATFPYELAPLSLDLQRLPWPFFLERGRAMDPVTMVLPEAATAEELQAGYVVLGAFGRMTGGKIPMTSITSGQLSDELMSQSHLVLVGKPSAFPMFSDLQYPLPLSAGQFSSPALNPEDGIVQILASPWNSSRVILVVSGNTDQGVVKASQALSTSNLQTGSTPDYSIVAQVNPFPSAGEASTLPVSPEDLKFSDLGYTFADATGIGTSWITYEFTVPAGQMPVGEVYLDLNLSVSTLVDPNRSEGVAYLNDVQIGSIALTTDASNLVTSRIYIPLSAIKPGANVLDLVFNLFPRDECSLFSLADMWVTVFPDSNLHLPLGPTSNASTFFALQDIMAYPAPFTNDPSLSTTTFVLSPQDPGSWLMAGKIAFDLGTRATNPVLGLRVAFDGQVPDELKNTNLILVGEPRQLGILSELKDAMPAYYESGGNLAVLESLQVIYRIAAEKSLGYLQLFTSPWNDQAAILGIFGTNPEGLGYAVTSILDATTRGTLSGNFVTVEGSHALVVDTRTGLGVGHVGTSLGPAVVAEEIPASIQPSTGTPATYNASKQLIFTAILVVLGLIALTMILILVFSLRKRSTQFHPS